MSIKNAILITLENAHDAHALGDMLHSIIEALREQEIPNGEIEMFGGMNISEGSVTGRMLDSLVELIEAEVAAAHIRERLAEADDEVIRELPEFAPKLKIVH